MKKLILLSTIALVLFSCDKERTDCPGSTEQTFNLTGFNRISAGETFRVTITKGTGFSVKASGCSDDLADLELSIGNGNELDIHYKKFKHNRYRVNFTITMPQLSGIIASGASEFTMDGFGGQNSVLRTVLSGTAVCNLNGTGINTSIDLSGASKLTVSGNTESLYGNIAGDSRLYSYGLTSTEVDVMTSGTSKAWVFPQQAFYVMGSGDSRVYYKGNPVTKSFMMSGTSQVIKE